MADVQDVLNTMAALVSAQVYPSGTGQPSIAGSAVNVYPGWPMPNQIDTDMAAGAADVSIFQAPQMTRNTSRYAPTQHVMSVQAPTLTLTQAGLSVTVGGAMPSPFTAHNMAVLIGNAAFIYPVQTTDTLTSIATGLATLIAAAHPGATSSGPTITLPAGATPKAVRVGTTGQVTTEWEREESVFMVTVWAPTPAMRSSIGAAIRAAFAQMAFMTMPDGFGAHIKFKSEVLVDTAQKEAIYRRDLLYAVEYATTSTQQLATVVAQVTQYETQTGASLTTTTN